MRPEEVATLKPGDPVVTRMHGGSNQGRSRHSVMYVQRVSKVGKIQVIGYPTGRKGGHVMTLRPHQVDRA